MTIEWSELLHLDAANLQALDKPGVFRLSYKDVDGNYYIFFVGKSDTFLKETLEKFLQGQTSNLCILSHLKNLDCYFKYSLITSEPDRKDIERTMYEKYKPTCNSEIPDGKLIEVNFD